MIRLSWSNCACRLFFGLLLLLSPCRLLAQDPVSSGTVQLPDTSLLLLCGQEEVVVDSILFEGNRKTRRFVLENELDFGAGTTLPVRALAQRLEKNRVRLFNLQLFIWVKAQVVRCREGRVQVQFMVQERWYLWPVPIFSLADRNFNAWWDKRDFNRIDYGLHVVQYNFRGRNEQLKINLQHGFNRKYEVFYQVAAFRKRKQWGLVAGASQYQSHSLDFTTTQNRLRTYRQDRGFPIERFYVLIGLIHRRNIQNRWLGNLYYHQQQVSDSVLRLNPDFLLGSRRRSYLEAELTRVLNYRNTFSYPLSGSYFSATLSQNVPLSRAAAAKTSLGLKYARYVPLARRWYYAAGLEGRGQLSRQLAYADNRALGYGSYVRGYQLYVIDGQQYGVLMQGLTFSLLTDKEIYLKPLRNPRFNRLPLSVYLNAFADVAYVADRFFEQQNRFANRALWGAGLGLHLVTYYDRVLVIEYSVNHALERGFYLRAGFPF